MSVDLGVGSHVPILAAAIARTTGPILECGTGHWSTHMIRWLARGREVNSMDTDKAWLDIFIALYEKPMEMTFSIVRGADQHHGLIATWVAYGKSLNAEHYKDGICFLDQSPGEARVPMAKAIKGKFKFIVAHDTEADIPPGGGNYGWKQLDGYFKYQYTFMDVRPWTTVYSDVEEFKL